MHLLKTSVGIINTMYEENRIHAHCYTTMIESHNILEGFRRLTDQ